MVVLSLIHGPLGGDGRNGGGPGRFLKSLARPTVEKKTVRDRLVAWTKNQTKGKTAGVATAAEEMPNSQTAKRKNPQPAISGKESGIREKYKRRGEGGQKSRPKAPKKRLS